MFGRRNRPQAPAGPLERLKGRAYHDDGGRTAYAVLLCLLSFLLVVAVAFWQLTAPSTGRQLLENGIVALTDIDTVIHEQRQAMKDEVSRTSQPLYTIPGYPLDVYLTASEIQQSSDAQLRTIVLDRSSALVYGQGLSAFDRTGSQSLPFFSSQGVLNRFVGLLNADNHDHARLAAIILALIVALVAIMAIARGDGFGRLRALGLPLFIAGLLGVAITIGGRFFIDRWWSGDPFSDDVNEILRQALDIATRDFAVLAGLGIFLTVLGIGFQIVAGRLPAAEAHEPLDDDHYDPAYDEELELS
jgi:hypothetical protein